MNCLQFCRWTVFKMRVGELSCRWTVLITFWRSIWKSEIFLLDGCHICWLMSKTDNGLKWPKSCFKCFKLMTKSSLPVSSNVMKIESIRKVSNKISATKHSRRPIIVKRSLSARKVWYAIFFSGEGVAIKVPVEKGKNITKPSSTKT